MILYNLAVHHSKHFNSWLENKKDKIEVFYLPSYLLKMDPDERLNRDLKSNFHFTRCCLQNSWSLGLI